MRSIEELQSMTIGQIKHTTEYKSIPRIYNKSYLSKTELINLIIIIQEESIIQINNEEEEEDCMICFESLNNGNVLQLYCCKKPIHNTCLTTWEDMNKYSCPHCRSKRYRLIPRIRRRRRRRVIHNRRPIVQRNIPPINIPDIEILSPLNIFPPIYSETLVNRRHQRQREFIFNQDAIELRQNVFDDFNLLGINLNRNEE